MIFRTAMTIFILTLVILVWLTITAALTHEWYERSCCSGEDCRPVPDGMVENKADGVHVQGHGVLSYNDPRLRWSRDNQDHLCVPKGYVPPKLNCVYRRYNGM